MPRCGSLTAGGRRGRRRLLQNVKLIVLDVDGTLTNGTLLYTDSGAQSKAFHVADELLPSGQQAKFDNRVGWARTALRKAGLFDAPKRAFFCITDRGRDVALSGIPGINDKYFLQFAEHREYRGLNDKIVAD